MTTKFEPEGPVLTENEQATADALGLTTEQYIEARDAADVRGQRGGWEYHISVLYVGDPQREHATQIEVTRLRDGESCTLQCGMLDDETTVPVTFERHVEGVLEGLPHRHLY